MTAADGEGKVTGMGEHACKVERAGATTYRAKCGTCDYRSKAYRHYSEAKRRADTHPELVRTLGVERAKDYT